MVTTPHLPHPWSHRRGSYTNAFKAEVIALVEVHGLSAQAVADARRINVKNVRRWVAQSHRGVSGDPDEADHR
jgi:transposase-like protein